MPSYQHKFVGHIELIKYGRMRYGGVFLPAEILEIIPQARKRGFRLAGEVGGLFSEFGLMPVKTSRFIVLSRDFLADGDLSEGDKVLIRFSPIDPDRLDIPIELKDALNSNFVASRAWSNLTTGKKRECSLRIYSAARESTRVKRAYDLVDKLMELADEE